MKLIVCAGMPRAGSTLQWQVVESIVRLTEPKAPSRRGFRKCGPLLKQERPGFVVIKVHRFWDKTLPFKPKVITCFRDPRGFAASRMRIGWNLERVLQELPLRIENFNQWVAVPGALAMRYESMIKDLVKTTLYIARWLELPVTQEQAQKIAAECILDRHHTRGWEGHRITRSDWKEDLTAAQQGRVVKVAEAFMLRVGYLKEAPTT